MGAERAPEECVTKKGMEPVVAEKKNKLRWRKNKRKKMKAEDRKRERLKDWEDGGSAKSDRVKQTNKQTNKYTNKTKKKERKKRERRKREKKERRTNKE